MDTLPDVLVGRLWNWRRRFSPYEVAASHGVQWLQTGPPAGTYRKVKPPSSTTTGSRAKGPWRVWNAFEGHPLSLTARKALLSGRLIVQEELSVLERLGLYQTKSLLVL